MNEKTLFLAWQDTREASRPWFPVGRLDADAERSLYRFRYTSGAERAQEEAKFPLLIEFPELNGDYRASELFPFFQNRVMNRARPDFADYLRGLDLPLGADPIEILSVNGGRRVTDAYEVFPKPMKHDDGSFTCRFFLDGWQHVNPSAQEQFALLGEGEKLYVTLGAADPATGLAAQIQTTDAHMIGWAPRYLMPDPIAAIAAQWSGHYEAEVVRINSLPMLPKQYVLGVLIEMRGYWDEHEPMTGGDFEPLVA